MSLDLDLIATHAWLADEAARKTYGAAFAMWELLRFCETKLPDEAALEMALGRVEDLFYAGPWGARLEGELSGQTVVELDTTARRHFAQCRELRAKTGGSVEWLRKAIAEQDWRAIEGYGRAARGSKHALPVLEEAWLSGEISATSWLAATYGFGYFDEDGNKSTDPVLAHAYRLLCTGLYEAKHRARGPKVLPFMDYRCPRITEMERGLRGRDMERAQELAKEMLRNNPRCCWR